MTQSPTLSVNAPKDRWGLTGVQRRQIRTFLTALLFLAPSLAVFSAFVFIPLVRSFILSSQLTDPIGRPVAFYGLEHYRRLFATPVFMNSLMRSVQFVLYTVPATVLVSLGLALLGNLRLKRIDIFRMIFSLTIAVSAATASLIFKYLFHPAIGNINYLLGLIGIKAVPWLISDQTALIAVALTTVWLSIGLNTVILLAAMQGIPDELFESAMIDGANAWNKFKSITLPMLSPTIFFLVIVDMLAAFQTFTQIHVMTGGGPLDSTNVLVFSIYREFYFNGKYGFAAAQSIMLFLIMLVLTVFQFTVVERKVHYE
jgi:ABC-type sugar transport system permease subunit